MARPTFSNGEIDALVSEFTNQLYIAIRRSALEQVVAALGGSAPASSGKRRGRPPGSKSKSNDAAPVATVVRIKKAPKGHRRSADDVAQMGEALVAHVKANPGQRGEEIAKALRTDVGTMRLPMLALIEAKKVKTQGQRRGMRYFVAGASVPTAEKPAKKQARRGRKKQA
jgi:hypothetical protein